MVRPADDPRAVVFLHSEDEIGRLVEEETARRGGEVRVIEDEEPAGAETQPDLLVMRIYEHAELETLVKTLLSMGLEPRRWSSTTEEPHYRLSGDDAGPRELASLQAVLEEVRKAGQRNVEVQRYKGLGEMNADQLWATTMDPEHRTLLRVTLTDAMEADRLFGLLMGESVEPRRKFIEQHALDVKDLDV
jgi:DNA gyrase subunit B